MEHTKLFPKQNIIPKTMMTPYSDGLLPDTYICFIGLRNIKTKEFLHILNTDMALILKKEKEFLFCNKYLDTNSKTNSVWT